MALLNRDRLNRIEKIKNSVHQSVESSYTIFVSQGKKYIQIDTYGKDDRQYTGKVSQSIQLDEDTAMFLSEVLKNEFNLGKTVPKI